MRFRVVTPLTTRGLRRPEDVNFWARPDAEASHTEIETGPVSIESVFDETLAVPGMIAKIVAAEREDVDVELLAELGLSQSRATNASPRVKAIVGYDVGGRR